MEFTCIKCGYKWNYKGKSVFGVSCPKCHRKSRIWIKDNLKHAEWSSTDIKEINLDHWIQREKNDKLLFRFDGQDVRAVFTTKYIPVDNFEVAERLDSLGYGPDTEVQCHLDPEFMSLSIPDGKNAFDINGDRFKPGISISNSEVGLASLSIAAFVLRLVCTNGLVAKSDVSASYRHVNTYLEKLSDFNMDEYLEGTGEENKRMGTVPNLV